MDNYKITYKKVAVLGMGMEGVACVKFLADKCESITILDQKTDQDLLADKRSDQEDLKEILHNKKYFKELGSNYLGSINNYDIIFRSPGFKVLDPIIIDAQKNGVVVSSQMQLFFDLCPAKIVGITGTKGKGTTASILESILINYYSKLNSENLLKKKQERISVYLAGNIGKPAISLLGKIKPSDKIILELSSFQLQDIKRSPHLAIITNLGVDHLDYHKSVEEYHKAKSNIFIHQKKSDYLLVNSNVPDSYYKLSKSQVFTFANKDNKANARILKRESSKEFDLIIETKRGSREIITGLETNLIGDHNLENIASASLAAYLLGASADSIRIGIKNFQGLPHRLEPVAQIDGVKYFNDSFATNPDPTIAAVKSFNSKIVLILGGSSKSANFSELIEVIISRKVKAIVLIGDEADRIYQLLIEKGYKGIIEKALLNFDLAIDLAKKHSVAGDVILFSPACASFDMFKNYKDRGEQFKQKICQLIK